jgi:predicted regulator of Ras-like GTPase activity (Roadblock/LC7/MglB family)
LIALQDGLLVSSQLPPPLSGETIAAFLPQMFGRMSHYTKELKLGEPSSLTLRVDGLPLEISKVASVYFLALGRVGEPMPTPQLDAIAGLLKQQSKSI